MRISIARFIIFEENQNIIIDSFSTGKSSFKFINLNWKYFYTSVYFHTIYSIEMRWHWELKLIHLMLTIIRAFYSQFRYFYKKFSFFWLFTFLFSLFINNANVFKEYEIKMSKWIWSNKRPLRSFFFHSFQSSAKRESEIDRWTKGNDSLYSKRWMLVCEK